MCDPSPKIIAKFVCDEHRVRLFNQLRVMERVKKQELRIEPSLSRKGTPKTDRSGRVCVFNENSQILDDAFPSSDPRHTVAKTHRHLTESGEAGFGRKHDPKSITSPDGTVRYLKLPHGDAVCELCEGGDMISPWARFTDSSYQPGVLSRHRRYHKMRTWVRVKVAQIREKMRI
jgi:hypothetical protein